MKNIAGVFLGYGFFIVVFLGATGAHNWAAPPVTEEEAAMHKRMGDADVEDDENADGGGDGGDEADAEPPDEDAAASAPEPATAPVRGAYEPATPQSSAQELVDEFLMEQAVQEPASPRPDAPRAARGDAVEICSTPFGALVCTPANEEERDDALESRPEEYFASPLDAFDECYEA